jgi:hypothetical protein
MKDWLRTSLLALAHARCCGWSTGHQEKTRTGCRKKEAAN